MQANPHKRLRQLYGPRMMAQYRGVPLGELSPHVYAIAEQVRSGTRLRQAPRPMGMRAASEWWSVISEAQCCTHRMPLPLLHPPLTVLLLLLLPHPPAVCHHQHHPLLLQAYAAMMMDEARQAILISGESGAGKTESAKMVMQVGGLGRAGCRVGRAGWAGQGLGGAGWRDGG